MKAKASSIVIAAILVLSLSIGGTIMLLTATSRTATNVVTMGSGISAILKEDAGKGLGDSVQDGLTTGFHYGAVQPGQILVKEPYIVRDDSLPTASPAYVAVHAKLNIDGADASEEDLIKALLAKGSIDVSPDWVFVPNPTDWTEGWFFYIDTTDSNKTLKPLLPGMNTPPIFKTIEIPGSDILSGVELDFFASLSDDVTVEMALTAYLIQYDNNVYYDSPIISPLGFADYQKAFKLLITSW